MRLSENNLLLITIAEWENAGLTYVQYENARKRKQLEASRGGNGRTVEITFDTLPDRFKDALNEKYTGNIYLYYKNEAITEALKLPAIIKVEAEAKAYYQSYKSANGKFLPRDPKDYVKILTQAATWLEFVNLLFEKALPLTAEQYKAWRADNYKAVRELLEEKNVLLPYSYTKLTVKRNEFIKGDGRKRNFAVLIPKTLENTNSKKLKNAEQLILLKQLHGRQANMYSEKGAFDFNLIAAKAGWTLKNGKPLKISTNTAINYLKPYAQQLNAQREGLAAWRNDFDLVVKRERPSMPLHMTNHDGWDYERYYLKEVTKNGKTIVTWWNRKVVIMVTDAYNDYILGYCICDTESATAIKVALKSAVDHIKGLTGNYALPWQIKCDNFALPVDKSKSNDLLDLYNAMAYHPDWVSRSAVGNARDKVIEQWFEKYNTKNIQEHTEDNMNWSGRNVTAQNNANREWLAKVKNDFPDEQGVINQIHEDIARYRATKQAEWLNAWNAMPKEEKRIIDREEYLKIFGIQTAVPKLLTNEGLNPTINGREYWYMDLDRDFFSHIGTRFTITYDPWDMSSIMATQEQTRKVYIVPLQEKFSMTFKGMKAGERERLNKLLEFKKQTIDTLVNTNASELDIVRTMLEAESFTKLFPTVNGGNKGLMQQSSNQMKAITPAKVISNNPPPVDDNGDIDIYALM